MRRKLLNFATILSLLLLAATVALWVRGRDQFIFSDGGRLWWVMSDRSGVYALTVESWPSPERARWIAEDSNQHIPTVIFVDPWTKWRRLVVDGEHGVVTTWLNPDGTPAPLSQHLREAPRGGPGHRSTPMPFASVRVSHWMLIVVFAAVPLLYAGLRLHGSVQRRRRAARGQCISCGYDLRATPERCPECGRSITRGDRATA